MFEPRQPFRHADPAAPAPFDRHRAGRSADAPFQPRQPVEDQGAPAAAPDPMILDAYASGFADGRAEADADIAHAIDEAVATAVAAERAATTALADAVARLATPPPDALARALARRLADALVAAAGEACVDDRLLEARCAEALRLARGDAPDPPAPVLLLHPDDAARLMAAGAGGDMRLGVVLTGDATLRPGSLRLTCGPATVIDGVVERAAAIAAHWTGDPSEGRP